MPTTKKSCTLKMMDKRQEVPLQPIGHTITVSTLNCRGLSYSYETIYEAINTNQPDIMVLTETELNSSMKWVLKKLQRDMPEYQHHNSSHSKPDQTGLGSGGVILLIIYRALCHNHQQSRGPARLGWAPVPHHPPLQQLIRTHTRSVHAMG